MQSRFIRCTRHLPEQSNACPILFCVIIAMEHQSESITATQFVIQQNQRLEEEISELRAVEKVGLPRAQMFFIMYAIYDLRMPFMMHAFYLLCMHAIYYARMPFMILNLHRTATDWKSLVATCAVCSKTMWKSIKWGEIYGRI